MATSTTTPLETLPLLVLERICKYLDDNTEKRRSLWAFSLTSRCCSAAAAAQRFCQIQLKILAPNELESELKRWTKLLTSDGRHCDVRRLKVSRVMTERKQERQDEKADDDADDWNICHFDMHDFCRPSKACIEGSEGYGIPGHPEDWVPLGRFISQLRGLQDLVWAYDSYMPPSVLSAVSAQGCRLHMHYFCLSSLVQVRDSQQPIDIDDYKLATSPCLSSIVVRVGNFQTDGKVNYTEEAVMRLVTGMAPSLAHACLIQTLAGASLALGGAVRLGKPTWGGFFPLGTSKAELPILGSLRSLVFTGYVSRGIKYWAALTDFSTLHCLTLPWRLEHGVTLAEIAIRGSLKSLHTLKLLEIEDETDQAQKALNVLLENLNPLQRLDLSGYISNAVFEIILRRHGGALYSLSIYPYRDRESRNPLVVFSAAVLQRLAKQCPNLEQVELPISRTRGDDQETGIYRALSRLPRLRCAFLRLGYWIGPDEESWDEERDGEHPLTAYFLDAEEIPFAYLREAFSNSAIDATLALSIFNLISSGGSLSYLRLQINRNMRRNAPGAGLVQFNDMLRWFNRSWICKRDVQGRVNLRELDREGTLSAGEEWQYLMSDEAKYNREEIYKEVFQDIWPQRTLEWWKDWKSLPLSDGEA